jgi:gliding motility-associated-like protein
LFNILNIVVMKFIKLIVFVLLYTSFCANSQCNTNISICTPGVAGPFTFNAPSANPSSCLDYWNGAAAPNYAYITLYITTPGPLNLLINGDLAAGCLDVALFDITGEADPCASLSVANELACNYAAACDGCSEFGATFAGCDSETAAPIVNAGDVIMILVEDWSGTAASFTLELDPTGAQTGPGDPTITPAGPFLDSDPAVVINAANGGGTWTASCGACIDPTTGSFDPAVAGNGTHQICYDLGSAPCDSMDCIDIIVGPSCFMNGLTANANIVCPSATYTTTGIVTFTAPPANGILTISDCNGNQQVFNPPFVSPLNYSIPNQVADGLACDITAVFSSTPSCTINTGYTAPICPCNIDVFTVNIGTCNPATNTYSVNGSIDFSMPPANGTLTITVDDGISTYDTIINSADFISPLNFSISGLDPNGAATSITAVFSADGACSSVQNYVAPANCNCTAAIGTFSQNMSGDGQNDFILCFGDQFNYQSNGDWTAPLDVNANSPGPPPINYEPGIGYLLYSCPPTVGLTPDNDPATGDPCLEGLILTGTGGLLYNDINDLAWINTFPPGTFTDNIIYYVPVTMYDITNGWYSVAAEPCFELGPSIAVQYLPEVKSTEVEDCQAGSIISTIIGGQSELDGTNYTVVNGSLTPANASFQNSTCIHGGTITVNGLTNGQNYSFDIMDNNGCPLTISGTFIGTENPGFSYDNYTICTAGADPIINISGDPGTFSYVMVSGGPTLSLSAATGAIDVSTSNPGVYDITYTTSDAVCFSDSIITITINETPTIDAMANQTVCDNTDFADINFTGTNGATFDWTNSNNTIGLIVNGTGNISGFTGTNNSAAQISGTVTVTPTLGSCIGTAITFDLIVDPQDDASFEYVDGLTYCLTGTNPVANILGTQGNTFNYTTNQGGPNLGLNTVTGDIDLTNSQLGSYDITYTTNGACPETSTLTLVITNAPEANFSFGTYCLNADNEIPDYVNDEFGVPFTDIGNGGMFTEPTGNISINPNTGEVILINSTPGTYTITNTINIPGCALAVATNDITILELPTAQISGGGTICPEGDLSTVDIEVEFTSTGPWDLTFSHNGVNQNITNVSPLIINGAQFGFGDYELISVTDANGCTNSANGLVTIDTYESPSVHPMNNYSACEGNSLEIDDFFGFENGNTFHWNIITGSDVGFGTNGITQTGIGTFIPNNSDIVNIEVYPVSINECIGDTIDFDITINPVPNAMFTVSDTVGCEPTSIVFTSESTGGDIFEWHFGNGESATGNVVSFNYEYAGLYDISLTVSTNEGCADSLVQNAYISITPTPIAAFSYSPDVTDISNTEIEFTNSSIDAETYIWDFGDESAISNATDPIHIYPDIPGQYIITLIASNNGGVCTDIISQQLIINDIILYYIPNIFTPDQDEYNETFKPIFTSGFDPFDYHLMIYNRWGEVIFESYNAANGWDGTYPEGGELCQDGVYIWKIEFKETMSDKRHRVGGHVTLLK